MPRLAAALALLALALAPAASLAAEGDADGAAKKRQRLAKQVRLKAFGSCRGLVRYGRRHARQGPGALAPPLADLPTPLIGAPPPSPAPGVPEPLPAPAPIRRDAAETESEDSGTNVQELGVDEPDLVKAGGGRIFVVAGERLHAVDAGGLKLLGSLPLEGFGHQLLLDGDRLLVISQTGALEQRRRANPAGLRRRGDPADRGRREQPGGHARAAHRAHPRAPRELPPHRTQRARRDLDAAAGGRRAAVPYPAARLASAPRPQEGDRRAPTVPARRALPARPPAGAPLRHRHAERAHDRHGEGPARRRFRRRHGGRADRLRIAEGALCRHAEVVGRRRHAPRRAHADPQVLRDRRELDELPRERPGRGPAAQPVLAVGARRRAAGGDHGRHRPGEREPGDHARRARWGPGAARPGRRPRQGRAHIRGALHR